MPIVPNCIGGLGNQIFIAVAGYLTAKETKTTNLLPVPTQNSHNQLNLDYRETVLKYLGQPLSKTVYEYYREHQSINIYSHSDFQPWSPSAIQEPAILEGYYQYVDPILCQEDEIRERILLGIDCIREKVKQEFPFDFSTTGFLHVRRGDYLTKPSIHFNQTVSYYKNAYNTLPKKPTKLLLLSDDPDWLESQAELVGIPGATIIRLPNEVESLALMSLCGAGSICANSTFSWWGAFLGPYAKRAPIIVPKRWISFKTYSLFPPEWIIIDG